MKNATPSIVTCGQCKHSERHPLHSHLLICKRPEVPKEDKEKCEPNHRCGRGEILVANKKQRQTLMKLFERPTPSNIQWKDIQSMLFHLGFEIKLKASSAVKFVCGEAKIDVHVPHSAETPTWTVRKIRDMLSEYGVNP